MLVSIWGKAQISRRTVWKYRARYPTSVEAIRRRCYQGFLTCGTSTAIVHIIKLRKYHFFYKFYQSNYTCDCIRCCQPRRLVSRMHVAEGAAKPALEERICETRASLLKLHSACYQFHGYSCMQVPTSCSPKSWPDSCDGFVCTWCACVSVPRYARDPLRTEYLVLIINIYNSKQYSLLPTRESQWLRTTLGNVDFDIWLHWLEKLLNCEGTDRNIVILHRGLVGAS